jgi:hypothetical protein
MKHYAKLNIIYNSISEYPILEDEIKSENPHFLYPLENFRKENKEKFNSEIPPGFIEIEETKPSYANLDPNLIWIENTPAKNSNNEWAQTWITVNKDEEHEASEKMKRRNKTKEIKEARNALLDLTDQYVVIDKWELYSEEEKEEWRIYRQAIRDINYRIEDPSNIDWPEPPLNFRIPGSF